jgi:hypothetical protein
MPAVPSGRARAIARARQLINDALADHRYVHLRRDVREQLKAEIMSDTDWVEDMLDESLNPVLYDLATNAVHGTRQGIFLVVGDEIMRRDEFRRRARGQASRWMGWMEHVGDRFIRLGDMTRRDLLLAAQERRRRADREYKIADLWEKLAAGLAEEQRVGEVYTIDQIQEVAEAISIDGEGGTA